jgi:hypothetical protein
MKAQSVTPKAPQSMKKHGVLKIILTIFMFTILVLGILPFLINPVVSTVVKEQAAALFGDKLKIDSVNISFLTGTVIKANRIELAQAPGYGKDSLLKAGSVKIRVALLPLLKKQLMIHDITVVRPEIHIIQYRNGNMNLDYYLAMFSGKDKTNSEPGFALKLKQFTLNNGKIILSSYALSGYHQPALELTDTYLSLKNLRIPNPDKIATRFRLFALVGTTHPAKIRSAGKGVVDGDSISFTAKSKISGLTLADYAYLVPNASLTIKSGRAWIYSNANCHNNYVKSYQHVDIKDLKVAPKKGHTFGGTLLGTPANILVKALEDGKGMLNFDFTVSGHLNDLKANVKFKVIEAVTKSIRDKLGLTGFANKAASGIKKTGSKVVNTLKGIFKHKK